MRKLWWAKVRILLITAVLVMLGLSALLYTARAIVRPAPGDWATTLRVGPLTMDVGVIALIQWGTTPWIARQLDGRTLPTRLGNVHLTWDEANQQLNLQCQPCTLRSSSWGSEPLRLDDVRMTVRRNIAELHGTLQSGTVAATWHGALRHNGMTLRLEIPTTPVADGYALFARAIPEVATAQIGGTFALKATLELPSKKITLHPQLEGMVVQGLDTHVWAQAQSQCSRQGLPQAMVRVALPANSLLARAVLAAEDQRFYEHPGYDLVEMTKALRSNQTNGTSQQGSEPTAPKLRGASTLSQQVAKLMVTGAERSPVRKLRELLYAVEMEQTLGKARILRLYLDHAPWGNTVCGAQAAAYTYFGKRADQLTAAQAVWLAAMLHNPTFEAERWKVHGSVNQDRAQWVAAGLRPLGKAQRTRLLADLGTMGPP
jgi:hypothetical protein